MTTITSSVVTYRPYPGPIANHASRGWAVSCWRAVVFGSLFSIIFVPEFLRQGDGSGHAFIYGKVAGGIRFVDAAILLLALIHAAVAACSRKIRLRFPAALAVPGAAFLACVATGVLYGYMRGGGNFFFDWRGIALGLVMYVVLSVWMQDSLGIGAAIRLFVIYMGARVAVLYGLYFGGNREALLGVPIPIFDGPALSAIVFVALLASRYQQVATKPIHKWLWAALSASAYLIVVLSFRRTYWAELAIGTGLLLLLQNRHRLRNATLTGALLCLTGVVVGQPFFSRLQSFDVRQADSEFSADNADHWHDLQDAWEQVQRSPVLGIGVGTSYVTWRIRNWKSESVMVHNAPIHVWLKYGLAGLICYLWFHLALLRQLYWHSKVAVVKDHAVFCDAAFSYLTAQFAVTLGFAPWPYSELQMTTLLSFILAVVFAGMRKSLQESRPGVRKINAPPYSLGHHAVL